MTKPKPKSKKKTNLGLKLRKTDQKKRQRQRQFMDESQPLSQTGKWFFLEHPISKKQYIGVGADTDVFFL